MRRRFRHASAQRGVTFRASRHGMPPLAGGDDFGDMAAFPAGRRSDASLPYTSLPIAAGSLFDTIAAAQMSYFLGRAGARRAVARKARQVGRYHE